MKIAYVLHGNYNFISRAKRQISALKSDKNSVDIYNGYFSDKIEYSEESLLIKSFKIREKNNPLFNFLSLIFFNFLISKEMLKLEYDVIICRELSTLLAGFIYKKNRKDSRLVYDSNELSIGTHHGIKKFIWRIFEQFLISKCDLIIHAEKNRMIYFSNLYKNFIKNKKQIVVENIIEFNPKINTKSVQVKLLYFGVIGHERNIEEIIEVFRELKDYKIDLIGFGTKKYIENLKSFIAKDNISNVSILEPISDNSIFDKFDNYNIGIAFYPNTSLNNWYCAPNKVYQYLQCNMAILTTNNPGLVDLIEKYKIGYYIDEITPNKIKHAINFIVRNQLWNNITNELKYELSWDKNKYLFISSIKDLFNK